MPAEMHLNKWIARCVNSLNPEMLSEISVSALKQETASVTMSQMKQV